MTADELRAAFPRPLVARAKDGRMWYFDPVERVWMFLVTDVWLARMDALINFGNSHPEYRYP